MKIYLTLENGKKMFIPAPIWLVKTGLGMGKCSIKIAGKHMTEEQREIVRTIDFDELKKGFDVLKNYKGLTMVDVKSKDGTAVKIVV